VPKDRGFSQEGLAHTAGIARTYKSAPERGVYRASITMLVKLAAARGNGYGSC
jgi:DNA-binding XRE family transcriptional regulator